jgi:hypothetical protein
MFVETINLKKTTLFMRRVLIAIVTLVFVAGSFSCKKVVKAVFPGVDADIPSVTLTVPAIPFVFPTEASLGNYAASFNLDSVVRSNTGNVFGASDITSVKVKSITITITNPDALNNLQNFEYARLQLTSSTNNTPANITTINFPDVYASTITDTPTSSPELIGYLGGNQIYYNVFGKMRRITTKTLTMTVSVKVRIE